MMPSSVAMFFMMDQLSLLKPAGGKPEHGSVRTYLFYTATLDLRRTEHEEGPASVQPFRSWPDSRSHHHHAAAVKEGWLQQNALARKKARYCPLQPSTADHTPEQQRNELGLPHTAPRVMLHNCCMVKPLHLQCVELPRDFASSFITPQQHSM